jgi:hypothetical protein
MNTLPRVAQRPDGHEKRLRYRSQFPARESVILPQFDEAAWTVQFENRLMPLSYYVYMGGPVIVRIDGNTKSAEPQNRRHNKNPNTNQSA